jgi:hypothetical protein
MGVLCLPQRRYPRACHPNARHPRACHPNARHPRACPPNARHPRACPGDLPTISHHVNGERRTPQRPFLMGDVASPMPSSPGLSRGPHGEFARCLWRVPYRSVPLPDGGPRDKPEDDGGWGWPRCKWSVPSRSVPHPEGERRLPHAVIPGPVPGTSWRVRTVFVEGGISRSAPS